MMNRNVLAVIGAGLLVLAVWFGISAFLSENTSSQLRRGRGVISASTNPIVTQQLSSLPQTR
jgi:hypothetical protein